MCTMRPSRYAPGMCPSSSTAQGCSSERGRLGGRGQAGVLEERDLANPLSQPCRSRAPRTSSSNGLASLARTTAAPADALRVPARSSHAAGLACGS